MTTDPGRLHGKLHSKVSTQDYAIIFRQECTEATDSYHSLTPNFKFLKEWSQKYLFTVSNQWGVSSYLKVGLSYIIA